MASFLSAPSAAGSGLTQMTGISDLGATYEVNIGGAQNVRQRATATQNCAFSVEGAPLEEWSEYAVAITADGGDWTITLDGGDTVTIPDGETKLLCFVSPKGTTQLRFEAGGDAASTGVLRARVSLTASISAATYTTGAQVEFDTTDYDPDGLVQLSMGPQSRRGLVIPAGVAPKVVIVTCAMQVDVTAGTRALYVLRRRGGSAAELWRAPMASDASSTGSRGTFSVQEADVQAADEFYLGAVSGSGGNWLDGSLAITVLT